MAVSKSQTYQEVLQWASYFLESHGFESFLAKRLLLDLKEWQLNDYVKERQNIVEDSFLPLYKSRLEKLIEHYPLQYITGFEYFMGRKFKVSEATLIPRPDTEILVETILKRLPETTLKVLDIGTGTGIIGISLKANRPLWDVTVSDISADALAVAKENAQMLQVDLDFIQSDLFASIADQFDLIVSNPPYIGSHELDEMDESVKKYEPTIALFAEDEGLDIYKRLEVDYKNYLHENGKLVLEIGYQQGPAIKQLFGESQVEIIKDYGQQDRVAWIEL